MNDALSKVQSALFNSIYNREYIRLDGLGIKRGKVRRKAARLARKAVNRTVRLPAGLPALAEAV